MQSSVFNIWETSFEVRNNEKEDIGTFKSKERNSSHDQ